MKRCHEGPISTASYDILGLIYENLDSETQKNLSFVTKNLARLHFENIHSLRIFIPKNLLGSETDIFPNILTRYPKIRKLEIGPHNKSDYLLSLISYLKIHLDQTTNLISKIKIHEIGEDSENPDGNALRKLNRSILKSISHSRLESVAIHTLPDRSILTKEEIQPLLDQAFNLKKFTLIGQGLYKILSISFLKQAHLISAKFQHIRCPPKTIESLMHCPKLKTLVIDSCALTQNIVLNVLSKQTWNLKRLDLPNIEIKSDEELNALTKQLPQLEEFDNRTTSLSPSLANLTLEGLSLIGMNCKNLRILRFAHWLITNEGMNRLTKRLPHLEIFSFTRGYNITEVGVSHIARNCPQLHTLELQHLKRIRRSGFEALIQHCNKLTSIKIDYCGLIELSDIKYFMKNIPNLTNFKITNITGISEQDLEGL